MGKIKTDFLTYGEILALAESSPNQLLDIYNRMVDRANRRISRSRKAGVSDINIAYQLNLPLDKGKISRPRRLSSHNANVISRPELFASKVFELQDTAANPYKKIVKQSKVSKTPKSSKASKAPKSPKASKVPKPLKQSKEIDIKDIAKVDFKENVRLLLYQSWNGYLNKPANKKFKVYNKDLSEIYELTSKLQDETGVFGDFYRSSDYGTYMLNNRTTPNFTTSSQLRDFLRDEYKKKQNEKDDISIPFSSEWNLNNGSFL